jgi:hypothetical protein
MPSVEVDYTQTVLEEVSTSGTEGQVVAGEGYIVPVFVPMDQVSAWLAAYNPASSSSPNAADSRVIARQVLDALKKIVEG